MKIWNNLQGGHSVHLTTEEVNMKASIIIAFASFMGQIGTVGALECDTIGFAQSILQTVVFGVTGYLALRKAGVFND